LKQQEVVIYRNDTFYLAIILNASVHRWCSFSFWYVLVGIAFLSLMF